MSFNPTDSVTSLKENLQKSIQAVMKATGTGVSDAPSLIPYALSQKMTNAIQFMNPINELVSPSAFKAEGLPGSRKYEYPKLIGYRSPGSFSGEKGVGEYRSAQFDRSDVYIKTKKSRVKVWNLAKKASEDYIDMVSATWAAEAVAFSMDFALGVLYDNKILGNNVDKAFGGWENSLDVNIQTNRIQAFQNGAPYLPADTKLFKRAYIESMRNGGDTHKKVWLMSPEMAGLVTEFPQDKVRLIQSIDQAPTGDKPFEVHVGLWAKSLYNIPIIVTTLLGGGYSDPSLDTMGSVILTQAPTGGSMTDGAIYLKVTKLQRNLGPNGSYVGESMASAPATIVLNGGGSSEKITISFAQDPNALWYYVYACTTGNAADYKKVGVYPARTYDPDGNPISYVTSFDLQTITADPTLGIPSQGVFGKMQFDLPPVSTSGVNSETAVLWDLDEYQGLGGYKYLDESPDEGAGFATIKPIQELGDYIEYLLYSYGSTIGRYDRSSVMIRGLRSE